MPQRHRANLSRIRRCHSLEHSPTNALKQLSHQENTQTLRKERNKDKPTQTHQRRNQRMSISNPFIQESRNLQPNNLTTVRGGSNPILPASWDIQRPVTGTHTELGEPRWVCIEGARHGCVVALHYQGGGENHAPGYSFGIDSGGIAEFHALLAVVGGVCFCDERHEIGDIVSYAAGYGGVDLSVFGGVYGVCLVVAMCRNGIVSWKIFAICGASIWMRHVQLDAVKRRSISRRSLV